MFQNRSMRATWWDYSSSATYFITISTKDKLRFFGEVKKEKVFLNETGQLAHEEWLRTPDLRPQMKIELHEFVVMPDHFHALLTIGAEIFEFQDAQIAEDDNIKLNGFKPQSNNLASVVRGFKSAVTSRSKKLGLEFQWQSRYHDIIVRDGRQFENIERYIRNNPKNYNK